MNYFLELFLGGLTRGSIYALVALGYTMVYGIIELINFAHGEIYMIGAFTALIVASVLGMMGFTQAAAILLATAIVMIALTLLIKFTKIGKAMRATSQDKVMAALSGVNVDRVISFTFVIGSAAAAIGGVLIGSHVGMINFYIGFIIGIKAFVAAVLGGIGSIPGAVVGSFILGWTESFATGYVSSDYEDVFAFLLLVIILIFRPAGILGKKDRQKV